MAGLVGAPNGRYKLLPLFFLLSHGIHSQHRLGTGLSRGSHLLIVGLFHGLSWIVHMRLLWSRQPPRVISRLS